MITNAISYCNPFSPEYREVAKDFARLKLFQKIGVIVASIFAFLVTWPILGFGGLIAFRYVTNRLSNNKNQPAIEGGAGLYVRKVCRCSSIFEKVGSAGSFNMILILDRMALSCMKCSKKSEEWFSAIVKDLNHKIAYKKTSGDCASVEEKVVIGHGQMKTYPIDAHYAFFQIEIS